MKFFKEPFFQFLLLGALIFMFNHFLNNDESGFNEIIVTNDDVNRLKLTYEQNWNSTPDEETLAVLIQDFIDSEILYQEALKLRLDHNDEIVKRRLRQKYEFIAQDIASLSNPTETELVQFFESNKTNYQKPKTISFSQVYISPDTNEDAQQKAFEIFENIGDQDVSAVLQAGDRSYLPASIETKDESQVSRDFGIQFASTLFNKGITGWNEPIRSGLGWHVVFINDISAVHQLEFEEAQETVLKDWNDVSSEDFINRLLSKLRKSYSVDRQYDLDK